MVTIVVSHPDSPSELPQNPPRTGCPAVAARGGVAGSSFGSSFYDPGLVGFLHRGAALDMDQRRSCSPHVWLTEPRS